MKPVAYFGLDRGDRLIDWSELDAEGTLVQRDQLPNRPEKLTEWALALQARFPGHRIALGIEQPAASLLHFFAAFGSLEVYGLHPGSVAAYRLSFKPSRNKSDTLDAEIIARFVRDRHGVLKPFNAETPLTRRITALVYARRGLVDHRAQLTSRLVSQLKTYYPQAVELAGENLYSPLAIAFLRKWPTFQTLQRTRLETVLTFYRKHGCVRRSALARRQTLILESIPLTNDQTILDTATLLTRALLDSIKVLQSSIKRMEAELFEAYGDHPDAFIFESLPGSGRIHCARLLAAFGTDRERFPTARSILCFSGIAPVLRSTGNRPNPLTLRRRACPVFIKQSIHEWAAQSTKQCDWARAYYLQQKAKGLRHNTAVRALAYKWLRIIHRMWTDRTRYDDQAYLANLRKRGSPLIAQIEQLQKQKKNRCAASPP